MQLLRYLFLADVHGDFNRLSSATMWGISRGYTVFLLGDWLDSRRWSTKSQVMCLEFVNSLKQHQQFKYLFGNHELSYLFSRHRASGYTRSKARYFTKKLRSLLAYAQPYFEFQLAKGSYENYQFKNQTVLLTHAGLAPEVGGLSPLFRLKQESEKGVIYFYANSHMHEIGFSSGGVHPVGGISWARPDEWVLGYPNILQLWGHTHISTAHYDEGRNSIPLDIEHNKILTFIGQKHNGSITGKFEWRDTTTFSATEILG